VGAQKFDLEPTTVSRSLKHTLRDLHASFTLPAGDSASPMPCSAFAERAPAMPRHGHGVHRCHQLTYTTNLSIFPMTVIFRLMLRDLQPNSRTRIELSVCFITFVSQQPAEDREGCIGYAACQASSRRAISQSFSASWADTRLWLKLPILFTTRM
jgi:hypothetical protein